MTAGPAVYVDDQGTPYDASRPPDRVVSLVPSLTEAVAHTVPEVLVGATDWCTYPDPLPVARVGGTKWPKLDRVRALRPELVIANAEENRAEDVDALRAAGIPVWVTGPATVADALDSLGRMFAVLGVAEPPGWLRTAGEVWSADPDPRLAGRTVVVPIWRRPWMVVGRTTFAGDMLARLGLTNLYADDADRYPRVGLDELRGRGADLVVLPDEPYSFGPADGPEYFPGTACALVSGRHLTWYGPSLVEARAVLVDQLTRPVRTT